MKRTLVLAVLLITVVTSFSQVPSTQTKAFDKYVAPSVGFTPNGDLTYELEAGLWGNSSPISLSVVYDLGKNVEQATKYGSYIGVKTYFSLSQAPKLQQYAYFAPKYKLDNTKTYLLEFGYNPCIVLSENSLLSLTVGNQVLRDSPWNLFASVGCVFILRK